MSAILLDESAVVDGFTDKCANTLLVDRVADPDPTLENVKSFELEFGYVQLP